MMVIPQTIILETTSINADKKLLSNPLYKSTDSLKHISDITTQYTYNEILTDRFVLKTIKIK